jgi:hypothetical protein
MSDFGTLVSLDEQPTEASTVILDYTNRDFTAIRAQLIGLAKGLMPDWEPAGEASDFGTLLVELFAYMGDVMHYYIDRTASEAFIATAVRRQSMLYIADMLGYTPVGQHGAIVELTFTLDPTATEDVTLTKGTMIHNEPANAEEMVVFELESAVTLYAREPDAEDPSPRVKTAYATEGVTVKDKPLGTSGGIPNHDFSLPDKGVIYETLQVISKEGFTTTTWDYTSDLSLARPTQASFTTYIDENDMTHVVFGDNAAGRIPSVGAEIFATYRYGVGAEANGIDIDELTTIVPIDGTEVFLVSVTNKEPPVGGADPESIESMRYSVPRGSVRIKSRAVTLNDYADLAMQVPGVGKAIAYGTVYTAVHVRIAPTGAESSDALMRSLCRSVESYMADKVLIGSRVYAEPQVFADLFDDVNGTGNIYIRVTVHVVSTYNRTAVRLQVDSVLRQMIAYNTVTFGQWVTIGQVYRAVLGVQGVEWAEVNWLSTEPPLNDLDLAPLADRPTPEQLIAGQGAATSLFSAEWQWTTPGTTDPGQRHFRVSGTFDDPLTIVFSKTDDDLIDRGTQLLGLKIGDQIVMRPLEDLPSWKGLIVSLAPVDNAGAPGWVTVTVAKSTEGPGTLPQPANNGRVLFDIFRPSPAPSVEAVVDIQTPELLLPRIEPTEIEEDITNYPDWTEDERTHDGLWVWAVGGVTGS